MTYDLAQIRADFPLLQQSVHGKPLVYLDNAATTQKPRCVLDALQTYYTTTNANIHRGLHQLAEAATAAYETTRTRVAHFIGAASSREIIFTRNATEAINLVAQSYARTVLQPGDEILLTEMEHHSNLIPWQLVAKERGAELRFIPVTPEGRLDTTKIDGLFTPRTKILAVTLMSNVLGIVPPVHDWIARAHAVGAVVLLDAAQAIAHVPIDVTRLDCDFLAFSAHKLYGPTGVGVLYGKERLLEAMPPFLGGGEMIARVDWTDATWAALPQKFEAGTPNIADVVAFAAAIDYIERLGLDAIRTHELAVTQRAYTLFAAQSDVRLFGPPPAEGGGTVVTFTMDDIHPHDISQLLDFEGVAIRAGHHCAQPLMQRLGVPATARASIGLYTTDDEIDRCIAALDIARRFFRKKDARRNVSRV